MVIMTAMRIPSILQRLPCSGSSRFQHTMQTSQKKFQAYLLSSQNIYENLAFENWLYSNEKFEDTNLLLLWRSKPCVVIGRHQNPWAECDVQRARHGNIDIARRYSGGGTVYHDLGNLNCSFFTSRAAYDRTRNSQLIVDALKRTWDVDVAVASVRDDIFLDSLYKISGSSSKLGPSVAYHHCTLLFSVDKEYLSTVLHTNTLGLHSNATESVRSRVKNLSEVHPDMTFETLSAAIADTHLKQGDQGGKLEVVDPTDECIFSGIGDMTKDLKSWSMIYGRTPKFSVDRTFSKPISGCVYVLKLHIEVEKGLIKTMDVTVNPNDSDISETCTQIEPVKSKLLGARFLVEDIVTILESCQLGDATLGQWLQDCIRSLVTFR